MRDKKELKDLFQILKQYIRVIMFISILGTLIIFSYSTYLIAPKYQSITQILVNESKQDRPYYQIGEIQTNLELVNTYNVIIKSSTVLKQVIRDLNLDVTIEELRESIGVKAEEKSQVISISVIHTDKVQAKVIADKIVTIFREEVRRLMKVDNVGILSKSSLINNGNPISPNVGINTVLGGVFFLMLSIILSFILDYFQNKIYGISDVEKKLKLPLLGIVSKKESDNKNCSLLDSKEKDLSILQSSNLIRSERRAKGFLKKKRGESSA